MHRIDENGLAYYQFAGLQRQPAVHHAIFTRLGGVSRVPFETLNLGHTVGDDLAAVRENHRRVHNVLNVRAQDVVTAWLVHGCDVRAVGQRDAGHVIEHVDALITQARGLCLFMRFADCLPLLFFDPVQMVVGIAHAGWRGTVAGVGPTTVRAMQETFGSRPEDMWAGIGPGIGSCCYEVGEDVVNSVRNAFGKTNDLLPRLNGSVHFDVPEANRRQLLDLGIKSIEQTAICTGCTTREFFSHRAERGKTGRFGVAIRLL